MMKATFYSNFTEILSDKLKENYFINSSESESYIFIPNGYIKNWLMKRFCDDSSYGVAFDIKFVNFNNFLNFIQNKARVSKEKRFLNFLELSFLIRGKIQAYICNRDERFVSLYKYLIKDGKTLEKRLSLICDELAKIFIRYSIYGNKDALGKIKTSAWQAALFHDLYYKDGFSLAFRDLKKIDTKIFDNCQFHFFSINYIPPLFFDFIDQFSTSYHYINSPCMFFWDDITSDFERHNIQKFWRRKDVKLQQIVELEDYLQDRNSFLANMEKVKRNYLKIINEYEGYQNFENYSHQRVITSDASISLLNLFQRDILYLENRDENNLGLIDKEDVSLQIHISTSKFREVQVLHSNILNLLATDKKINLSDIHVISPNIDEYAPYIHLIFNDHENPISYKISDLNLSNSSHLISGLVKVFSLANSKWEKSDVLDLLENPLLQKKYKFSQEEIDYLIELLERANILWGLNKEHISKYLQNNNQTNAIFQRSWDKGFSRIIASLVFMLNDSYVDKTFVFDMPIVQLDMSSSAILDKFLKLMFSLFEDLKVIEKDSLNSLSEWRAYLKKIITSYFDIDDSFIEKSAYVACMNFVEDLKKISFRFKNDKFAFNLIYNHLKRHVNRSKTQFNPNNEQAINVSSFEISKIASKAVFIIGLDDDAIKLQPKSSLELIDSKDIPTDNDSKRSLFLEAMLSARDYLILSYETSLNSAIDSSIVIQELLFYLDKSYRVLNQKPSKYIVKNHESFSFHKSYFKKDVKNYSKMNFLAAKSFYGKENKAPKNNEIEKQTKLPEVINLQSLRVLCKNPIKFYLNKGLEIYLNEEKQTNEFNLSFLDKYIIRSESLKTEIEDILFAYEKKANIPLGIFYEIERNKIREDIKSFHENLKYLGVDKQNIKIIELDVGCEKVKQINKNHIQVPAIELRVKDNTVKIIGTISNISNVGLLAFSEDKLENIIRMWTEILVYLSLEGDFSKQIVFTKSKKIKNFQFDNPKELLSRYIEYYLKSLSEPSFMIKPFCEHILKADELGLSKEITKVLTQRNVYLDVYSKWFFENYKKPNAKDIIEKSSKDLQKLFQPVLEEI